MKAWAALLTISCSILLNPDGWFSFLSEPIVLSFEPRSYWDVKLEGGAIRIKHVTSRDEMGNILTMGMAIYNRDQWISFDCQGCGPPDGWGCW